MAPAGALLVARVRQQPIGCGALKFHRDVPAELKRMWLAPQYRGLGLGRRLLLELERHARRAGARTVRLETNRALKEAIQLYRRSGYREVAAFNDEPYAHHWLKSACDDVRLGKVRFKHNFDSHHQQYAAGAIELEGFDGHPDHRAQQFSLHPSHPDPRARTRSRVSAGAVVRDTAIDPGGVRGKPGAEDPDLKRRARALGAAPSARVKARCYAPAVTSFRLRAAATAEQGTREASR
jgi:acetyltransferase (GNAT) family protein